jgi:hypothetical protein
VVISALPLYKILISYNPQGPMTGLHCLSIVAQFWAIKRVYCHIKRSAPARQHILFITAYFNSDACRIS